jgi:diguanylate cyclase (GGDEF)-like protein
LQDAVEWEASKRLYEAAVRDSSTGAFNRRYFEQRLISDFSFASRHGTALCVLLIDIDHFKRINDRWGHPAGDMVLQHVAAELLLGMRADDLLARYGGEEFAVLARGLDVDGALLLAERLRAALERMSLPWKRERIAVTASIGVAHNDGAKHSDAHQLVAAADSALYAAKACGRNCVRPTPSPSIRVSCVEQTRQPDTES